MKSFILKPGCRSWAVSGAVLAVLNFGTAAMQAHGFEGDRFFPPTMATDDPFATDELLLPSVSYFRSPASDDGPAVGTTDVGFEFDKEIFPKFALGISGDYLYQKPSDLQPSSGFDDFTLSAKYQLWENAKHEAIFSVGGEWDMGGTGSRLIGRDPTSTFTPTIYFGKGFGDLPDTMSYVRPFALTGTVGQTIPTTGANPNALEWGLAAEYSLPYLQAQVKDIGLPAAFKNLIPLVELSMESPENRGGGGTTGTINPGVLYENRYFQLGAEAVIPINRSTGHEVGAVIQLQIFIDDIWPSLFGHPIFGN